MSMQQCRCQHLKVTADPQRELEWIEDIDIHTHCFKVGQVVRSGMLFCRPWLYFSNFLWSPTSPPLLTSDPWYQQDIFIHAMTTDSFSLFGATVHESKRWLWGCENTCKSTACELKSFTRDAAMRLAGGHVVSNLDQLSCIFHLCETELIMVGYITQNCIKTLYFIHITTFYNHITIVCAWHFKEHRHNIGNIPTNSHTHNKLVRCFPLQCTH